LGLVALSNLVQLLRTFAGSSPWSSFDSFKKLVRNTDLRELMTNSLTLQIQPASEMTYV